MTARHRVRTVTSSPDNYTVTSRYDALDRTHADSVTRTDEKKFRTTDSVRGMTLDLTASKTVEGIGTYRHYNSNRQMDSITFLLIRCDFARRLWWLRSADHGPALPITLARDCFARDCKAESHPSGLAKTHRFRYIYENTTSSRG